jgi:hypothetical protein
MSETALIELPVIQWLSGYGTAPPGIYEVVHLAILDHSPRFWLTVQSLCPETERARQLLVANAHRPLTPHPS